jgi:hypothetical protein
MSISVTPIPRLIDLAAPAFTLGTANAAGSAETAIASDSTLLVFDTTNPAAVSASAAVGSATTAPRRDHVHPGTTESSVNTLIATHTANATAHQTIDAVANQSEMESEAADRLVTAELMHFGPSAAKVWCRADAAGNITTSYNMTSVTAGTSGIITFNYATDFSSSDHIAIPGVAHATILVATQTGRTAGTSSYTARIADGTATNPGSWNLIAMGDQA